MIQLKLGEAGNRAGDCTSQGAVAQTSRHSSPRPVHATAKKRMQFRNCSYCRVNDGGCILPEPREDQIREASNDSYHGGSH